MLITAMDECACMSCYWAVGWIYTIGCFHVMSSKVAGRPFGFPSRQTLSEQFNET